MMGRLVSETDHRTGHPSLVGRFQCRPRKLTTRPVPSRNGSTAELIFRMKTVIHHHHPRFFSAHARVLRSDARPWFPKSGGWILVMLWARRGAERPGAWRKPRDMKGSATVELMAPLAPTFYARTCGRTTLARGHARSGDPVAMARTWANGDGFDQSVTDFSLRECPSRRCRAPRPRSRRLASGPSRVALPGGTGSPECHDRSIPGAMADGFPQHVAMAAAWRSLTIFQAPLPYATLRTPKAGRRGYCRAWPEQACPFAGPQRVTISAG
jgi:Uncharacterized protein conserved in bacteria (DUF2252)